MTAEDLRALALSFPGVEEGFSMNSTAFKANGKVLVRLLDDENAMLTGIGFDEREMLLETRPDVFHITPHYKDYPACMIRLAPFETEACRGFLDRRWREISPRRLVKDYDAAKN